LKELAASKEAASSEAASNEASRNEPRRPLVSPAAALGALLLAASLPAVSLGVVSFSLPAHAQATHEAHGRAPSGDVAPGHAAAAHGGEQAGSAEHAGSGGEHHQEFNWFHGMLGEKKDVEPSLLWRQPGTPVPFSAVLLNTLLLFALIAKFAREPLAKGLANRRQRIMKGIEDAAAMKEEAKKQLDFYRQKLDNLDSEIERVKREMRETAEAERARILGEAHARRARIEQEAKVLIEQELKAVREQLTRETARAAIASARELLKSSTSTEDHRRFCDQYLDNLRQQAPASGAGGGSRTS
jgi:F-type H+-transporting ATPase subunit b